MLSALAVVSSEKGFTELIGKSRGGFAVFESSPRDLIKSASEAEIYSRNDEVICTKFENGAFTCRKRTVSPIPESEQWFEKVLSRKKN